MKEIIREYFGYGGYTRQAEGYMSWQHLTFVTFFILIMIALAVILGLRNRHRSEKTKNKVIIAAAIAIDAIELFKIVFLCFREHDPMHWKITLPLFLCSIPMLLLPIAAFSKGRLREAALDFVFIFGLLIAFMGTYVDAMDFGSYPVLGFDNVTSVLTHTISGFSALYIAITGLATMKKENIGISFAILTTYCALAYIADILIPYNYMFLMYHDGTPYSMFYNLVNGSKVLYPIIVVVLFLMYISVFYLVYYLIRRSKAKKAKKKDNTAAKVIALVLVLTAAVSVSTHAFAEKETENSVSPKLTGTVPEWAIKSSERYTFDFSEEDLTYYSQHETLQITARPGMKVENGRLVCLANKNMSLATRGALGDDYGIAGGSMGFRMSITGGNLLVLLRVQGTELKRSDKGLRFEFTDKELTITDDFNNKSVELDISRFTAGGRECSVEITDKPTYFTVLIDGETVARITYTELAVAKSRYSVSNYGADLVFFDGSGSEFGRSENSSMQRAGHMIFALEKYEGYVDDLFFDRTEIDQSLPETDTERVIDYGNWVATDDLSRITPIGNENIQVRNDRKVGVFYFLCWVGAGIHVQDNTKIYLEKGLDGLKSYLEKSGGEAYWAEPYFGYYKNSDAWVYRKHAYMLEAAGVDFIFLDVSNREVFTSGHTLLFDTWLQIRKEGGHTPQICFLTGDTPETFSADVKNLRRSVYSEKNWEKYEELFFKWEGKPLIFGNISGVDEETRNYLNEKFTVRGCWAWCDSDGYWTWMDETWNDGSGNYVQHKGRDLNGTFEEMSVTAGHHASSSKGRSYVNGVQPDNWMGDFMFTYDETRKGLGFASQFEAAIKADPQVIMITGWNEWIAGNGRGQNYLALTSIKNVCYVDEFNPEFSRDIEPMKIRDGVGFGDNFYYQMVYYIRKYKGFSELKLSSGQTSIAAGDIDAWSRVGPEFRDTIGDVEFRDTYSYDSAFKYINGTGRNDFDFAKVSQDADYLYFMVKTVNDIVLADDSTWMNLLIDTDMDHSTGWEGYDIVLNRERDQGKISVEKFDGNAWTSQKIGDAEYSVSGQYLTVKLEKALLGLKSGAAANFDFKWTDNSTETGEIMEFMDLGDTAPNDRFNFRFVSDASRYEKMIDARSGKTGGFDPLLLVIIGTTALLAAAAVVVLLKSRKNRKEA
ncbi:MAG: YwaF family protein [Clostridia bacterium]|nr:YwaF family protein [Clostridia bacterium]